MPYKNIEDKKAYHAKYIKKHYQDNKEKYLTANRERKLRIKEQIRFEKSKPCVDCTVEYPYYVMQFDHTGEDKEGAIARAVSNGWSWAKIKIEIDKCDVVCANCHCIRTHNRAAVV